MVHRDIKPENILLIREATPLVADFGIARALGGGRGAAHRDRSRMGTPAYMSPEQAAGDRGSMRGPTCTAGRGALRDAGGRAAVHRRHDPGDPGQAIHRAGAERAGGAAERARKRGPGDPEVAGAGGGRSFRHRGAVRAGARDGETRGTADRRNARSKRRRPSLLPAPVPPVRAFRRSAVILVLGILIGLGVLFAWRRSSSVAAGGTGPKVLAVLPFENLGDSADAYFADGVTDEVRTKLAQVSGLEVIARGSSNEYRGNDEAAGRRSAASWERITCSPARCVGRRRRAPPAGCA